MIQVATVSPGKSKHEVRTSMLHNMVETVNLYFEFSIMVMLVSEAIMLAVFGAYRVAN